MRLTGHDAISFAEANGLALNKYSDPIEDDRDREGLTPAEARKVASEDPGLIYIDLPRIGWGLIGEPKEGVLVQTAEGPGLALFGYNEGDYWGGDGFLGEDEYGVTPVYRLPNGRQFPAEAKVYPYNA